MAEDSSSGLSAAQAHHVVSTFRHVDALLERMLGPLDRVAAEDSLTAVHNDFTADEIAALREAIAVVRTGLETGMRTLDLPASGKPVSGRWAAATAARLALISLSELDARHVAAYGAVDEAAAERLARVCAQLEQKLEVLRRLTDQPK